MASASTKIEDGSDQQFYSRQYYVYGEGAMQRLRTSRVLLIGINAAGAETAKNLALAGVSSLYLYDPTEVSQADVDANIWVSPGHLQRRATRAHAAAGSLRELNPRCQVQVIDPPVGG